MRIHWACNFLMAGLLWAAGAASLFAGSNALSILAWAFAGLIQAAVGVANYRGSR